MTVFEIVLVSLCGIITFVFGYYAGKKERGNDDGIVIINEERCEVIFRDPYEKLVKKKFVNLRIQS